MFIVFLCSAGWRLEGVEATTERGTQTVWRVGWISPFAAEVAPRLLGFRSVASLLSSPEEPHWRETPPTQTHTDLNSLLHDVSFLNHVE